MTLHSLDNFFIKNRNQRQTITQLSTDSKKKDNQWCASDFTAYNFDRIIQNYCKRKRKSTEICSVDALTWINGYLNFIEFKNSSLNKDERINVKSKVAESVRYFEKIILENRFFETCQISTRFILVCGGQVKNGPNSYTKINDSLQKLAGKRPLDEKGKFIKEYCELLEFFGEVYVLDSDEFRNQIEDYALPPL